MTNNIPKTEARRLLLNQKLYSLSDYNDLLRIIESKQFEIIEYTKHSNSENIVKLINKLNIENEIRNNDSFLYLKGKLRFIFINSDIQEEDKCALLRHELGHICDPDFKKDDFNYSKIKKEEFANEFSFYIKNPGGLFKLFQLMKLKWKMLLFILVVTLIIAGVLVQSLYYKMQSDSVSAPLDYKSDMFYVTSRGEKYHRSFCIIVKYRTNLKKYTLNEAYNKGYKPCLLCIGDN